MVDALPAHHTKHLPVLAYPFHNATFHLIQRNDGTSNGTALWLGAQILSLYLAAELKRTCKLGLRDEIRPKAVELGSGIGLTALALASLGYDVLATDIEHVCASVLRTNVDANSHLVPGRVHVRELEWGVHAKRWTWDDPRSIASSTPLPMRSDGQNAPLLAPPFDLIVSSDTIYDLELVAPLFNTIHALSALSCASSCPRAMTPTCPDAPRSSACKPPVIYLAIEKRDPALIATAITRAGKEWGLFFQRVPDTRLRRAGVGAGWRVTEWEGVEVWRGRWDGVAGMAVVEALLSTHVT